MNHDEARLGARLSKQIKDAGQARGRGPATRTQLFPHTGNNCVRVGHVIQVYVVVKSI
jgi:hypothetical protein